MRIPIQCCTDRMTATSVQPSPSSPFAFLALRRLMARSVAQCTTSFSLMNRTRDGHGMLIGVFLGCQRLVPSDIWTRYSVLGTYMYCAILRRGAPAEAWRTNQASKSAPDHRLGGSALCTRADPLDQGNISSNKTFCCWHSPTEIDFSAC